MLLAASVLRHIFFRSLRCIVDGMHLVVMRQMRLICGRHNVFRLLKLGRLAVVPRRVLMMLSGTLMEFAQN
jgi:hypothetical protein